eukprot:3085707-Pyramimonas_sp.AAC.1
MALATHCYNHVSKVGNKEDGPEAWKKANVTLLFKKGDTSLPSNYRPKSLLAVGCQTLAYDTPTVTPRRSRKSTRSVQSGFRPK